MSNATTSEKQRLDKWLWAARFFKTRQLAAEAISGGKVHLNQQRTKPGRGIKTGDHLEIHKGEIVWEITIEQLSKQRRPASEAQRFYSESEQSQHRRLERVAQIRAEKASQPRVRKPNKRDRRLIHQFKQKPPE